MRTLTLGTILKAAVVGGLAAGLTVALFHTLVTEAVIDQAIAIEEERHAAEGAEEKPMVSRDVQKGGLVIGFLIYGLTWALLFGVAYHGLQRWLPAGGARRQRLLLALAAYWAVGLFPFLKYPANPPGVGDPETITYRQALYLGLLALSIAGTVLAVVLGRHLGQVTRSGWGQWLLMPATLAVFSLILYSAMPSSPDPIQMPTDLVARFRALSLVGLTLFWAMLGFLFAMLLTTRTATQQSAP